MSPAPLPTLPGPASTTVLVAKRHAAMRAAVAALLESDPGLDVIGTTADIFATVREVGARRPDVLLVDTAIVPPLSSGAIARLRAAAPRTAVLLTGMSRDGAYADAARETGAAGYVPADASPEALLGAIRIAAGAASAG